MGNDTSPTGRIVKNRSIPNVETERLLHDIGVLHQRFHTPEGLHAHQGPRRELVDNGVKCLKIQRELTARKVNTNIDCRWCGN